MTRAIIVTGADRYDGKWHDHAATSHCVADVLAGIGIDARLRGLRPRYLQDLGGIDLVVVNAANGARSEDDATDEEWAEAFATLRGYVEGGGSLLALHLSSAAFREFPEWTTWIGGAWIAGQSMHPPISQATVTVHTDDHPIVAGFGDFDVFDEMYSYQDVDPANFVLASHRYEEQVHPIAWARELPTGRVVYDALGHDVRSYASPERARLLQREVQWLIEGHNAAH